MGGKPVNSFFIAFNAVSPLACYIITGIFIKRIRLVDDEFLGKLNRLLFKIFYYDSGSNITVA